MQPARTVLRKAFHQLDLLAVIISPLAIVFFLVLMIVLLDNFGTHMRLLLANRAYHWIDSTAALSICTLLGVQLMNPPRATEPHAPSLLAQDEA